MAPGRGDHGLHLAIDAHLKRGVWLSPAATLQPFPPDDFFHNLPIDPFPVGAPRRLPGILIGILFHPLHSGKPPPRKGGVEASPPFHPLETLLLAYADVRPLHLHLCGNRGHSPSSAPVRSA